MTTRKEKVNRRKSDPGTLSFRPVQERTTVAAELPWGVSKIVPLSTLDYNLPTGVYVGQSLLLDLFALFDKKLQIVTEEEPLEKLLNKSLQRGGDVALDNLCRSLAALSELCLPAVLDALLKWHKRMENIVNEKISTSPENKHVLVKKILAVNFLFCLVLIEVLSQMEFHLTTCEHYLKQILDIAFKQMQYKDPSVLGPNHTNSLIVAETFAEVLGVISESRFPLLHRHFVTQLTELRKETSPTTNNQIIALLMAMKFVKIKTNQVDDFEVGIKFLDDLAGFFLEVKDKDVKHAAAGLLVEILLPIAAQIKREANIPALITFVGRLYSPTNELASKKQHRLAAYPLLTCLLCVSQRNFFLTNWVPFLNNALANLKNKDTRISRVALESLYRLLWVYMIRNHSDSNSSTRTRLESICGSLFPKGNRSIVPRDAPLNIFVKIIHFIAQQKLDFAFKDVIFDLLCCNSNRSQRTIYPERMNIGLRALMVIADGLQQKDEPPAMPKSMGPSASGTMQRIKKKTYITRPLTVDIARTLGLEQYYVPCRKTLDSILHILDNQVGKPMMLTAVQKGRDVEELLGGDVKPKLDLFRTCVAAIPRLLPEPMSHQELIEIIIRLTVHMDEELRNLSGLTLQTMLNEFPEWRETIITSLISLIHTNLTDFYPTVLDDSLRLLLQMIGAWRQNAISEKKKEKPIADGAAPIPLFVLNYAGTLHAVEGLGLVMLCQKRMPPRKIAINILKEVKNLITILALDNCDTPVINVLEEATPYVIKKYIDHIPMSERLSWPTDFASICDKISGIEPDNCLINVDRGNEYLFWDPWACALSGYAEKQHLLTRCPTAVASAWPMLFSRLVAVIGHVDPANPQNESRASLLRGSKSKTSSVYGEVLSQDECLSLWQKYLVLCCAFAPPSVNSASLASRSFSPTSSVEADVLRSVSSSLRGFRVQNTMTLSQLLMKVTSMLRWENMTDIRDSVVLGIGSLNPLAFDSLLDELNQRQILREAQEKKVERNVRGKKKKDQLRLQLIRLFEVAVWRGVLQSNLLDSQGNLNPLFLEFIDSMRINLEVDQDRDQPTLTSLRLHFAKLVALIVESVPPENRAHLIPDDKKQSLFYLFIGWCSRTIAGDRRIRDNEVGSYVEQKAVLAMTRLLCCGPIFEATKSIGEDGYLYGWLEKLVGSSNHTMQVEVEEMLALMLDLNESSYLVDWLIHQCYVQNADVSARCFRALVRAFSRRDFPCEFVSLFVLCQAMCGDPEVVDVAVHMLELLKKQFLDANSTICSPITNGSPSQVAFRGVTNLPTSNGHCFPVEQETVCRNLSKLYPHLTITIFSEVSSRLEKAKQQNRGHLLSLLLPWIENMELVDTTVADDSFEGPRGWGSEEATQLLMNNLMHLTATFSTEYEHQIAGLWKALAVSFPANLPAILNYLYVMLVLSNDTLLSHAKRICVMISGPIGNRLAALLLEQLTTSADQSKLTLERVEMAPFYRWKDESLEKKDFRNDIIIAAINNSQRLDETLQEGVRLLPMPAYGGYYSKLSQFLPPATQNIPTFTRSQVALILICDLIRSSGDVDWTEATPRLLHSAVLNLDSLRPVLCKHARKVVINVCMLYADPSTYSQVSAILLKNQMSLTTTEPFLRDAANLRHASGREFLRGESPTFSKVAEEEYRQMLLHSNALFSSHSDLIKAVVFCLSENMEQPLWPNEDATPRNWKVTSATQLSCLVRHLAAELFLGPLPLLPVVWTQTAMRMALATPQRHLAGRCFQIVSSLCQSPCAWIPSLISRLVETAGEQHEETQAYVTDLLVCLLNSASTLSGVLPEVPPLPCASPTHTRSTSYTPALLRQSMINQKIQNDRKDARLSLLVAEEQPWTAAALVRSKSAEQLKSDTDSDEEATARVQMVAIAVALLESNLENEFLLALNLLEKILGTAGVHKVPCVQKLEKTIQQLEWKGFQNIVSLVVRGAIVLPAVEPSLQVQIQLLDILDESVIGGHESFGLIICHMVPYLLLNFEAPTQLCTEISSAVARYCKSYMEKTEQRSPDHPFNHLATVMIQYTTKTFTKDRWQWTKCVIQYVCEGLDKTAVTPMMVYLAEMLDKGPQAMNNYILNMLYLLVNQRDPSDAPLPINAQVTRVISRHVQGTNWREASRVYKAIVEQWQNTERDKESGGAETLPSFELDIEQVYGEGKSPASPRKNIADSSLKRQPPPHVRVRDRLVALLSASGLRVGLPSAQSVVFSQSELGSAASSTERICASSQEVASTNSLPDPSITDSFPRVFKEFDFLEAEHDSVSETAESCFGWLSTMRPTSLGEPRRDEADVDDDEDSESAQANSESGGAASRLSRTSQCSSEERTPCPSEVDELEEDLNEEEEEDGFDGLSIPMEESSQRQISPQTGSSLGFIKRSTQDLGAEEASVDGSSIVGTRSVDYYPNQPAPLPLIVQCSHHCDSRVDQQWNNIITEVPDDTEGDSTSFAILLATQIFRTSCGRVMTLLRDANVIFGSKPLSRALVSAQDSLTRVADCPFIFVTAQFLRGSGLMQRLKYSLYEMREHVETLNERKEQCIRMLNSVRSAYKLTALCGSTTSLNGQNETELAKLLSKTFFQLMQMNDALHHMLQLLEEAPSSQLYSLSPAVLDHHRELLQNMPDSHSAEVMGSTRNDFNGDSLVLLMANKRYSQALLTVRQLRLSLDGEFGCCDQTDIDVLLLLFCRSHTLKAWALVGAVPDAMRRQSDLLRDANADLATATAARRFTVDSAPQRTSTVSSLNESFSKLSYHPDM